MQSGLIPVNNIYPCVQGEGCNTGLPMIMLRLHGCNVGCPWCDTKETWGINKKFEYTLIEQAEGQNPYYSVQSPEMIGMYINSRWPTFKWVLISGGEPAINDLTDLTKELHRLNFKVALETSGTEIINGEFDWICVSPKIDMPGGKVVQSQSIFRADELKFVVGKSKDLEKLEKLLSNNPIKEGCQICLQPVSQSPKATKICIDMVQEKGWRLSIQIHKYLDIT